MLLLALQVAGPVLPPEPKLRAARECPAPEPGGEVVVCGRRDEPHRLKPLPQGYEPERVRAEAGLFGGTVAAETEAADVGGFVSNRAMVRFKLRF